MTVEELATEFMEHVFKSIEHGDEKHRAWLQEKCASLAPDLAKQIEFVRSAAVACDREQRRKEALEKLKAYADRRGERK